MSNIYFNELVGHLKAGVNTHGHPFRYAVLGTTGLHNEPQLRTVVLREVSDKFVFRIFTDSRSNKIKQLVKNNQVSLLFYHAEEMLQATINGKAKIITDPEVIQSYWSGIGPNAQKDYTTDKAPGSEIKNAQSISYLTDHHHFSIIDVTTSSMQYLKLNRKQHLKIQFTKVDANWQGTLLVP